MTNHTLTGYLMCRTPNCRTRPVAGYADRGLCGYCETAGRDAVTALAGDWAGLQPLIWDHPARGLHENPGGHHKPGPTVPLHLPTEQLASDILYAALLWEQPVREVARLSDQPPAGRPAADVARACLILTVHYPALLALLPVDYYPAPDAPTPLAGDGPDAVVMLTALHRRAQARIGLTKAAEALPSPCHVCGWPQLRHQIGADTVSCPNCRNVWAWDLYQDVQDGLVFGGAA